MRTVFLRIAHTLVSRDAQRSELSGAPLRVAANQDLSLNAIRNEAALV